MTQGMRFSSGMPMRSRWVEIAPGVSVPSEAVTDGPSVVWNHIDGPLMKWGGQLHWLTWMERLQHALRLKTMDQIADARFPHLAELRTIITEG